MFKFKFFWLKLFKFYLKYVRSKGKIAILKKLQMFGNKNLIKLRPCWNRLDLLLRLVL